MTGKHAPGCRWPKGSPCREFSTDGTLLGAEIAHTMDTTDEAEIFVQAREDLWEEVQDRLTGMAEEQAEWEEES